MQLSAHSMMDLGSLKRFGIKLALNMRHAGSEGKLPAFSVCDRMSFVLSGLTDEYITRNKVFIVGFSGSADQPFQMAICSHRNFLLPQQFSSVLVIHPSSGSILLFDSLPAWYCSFLVSKQGNEEDIDLGLARGS